MWTDLRIEALARSWRCKPKLTSRSFGIQVVSILVAVWNSIVLIIILQRRVAQDTCLPVRMAVSFRQDFGYYPLVLLESELWQTIIWLIIFEVVEWCRLDRVMSSFEMLQMWLSSGIQASFAWVSSMGPWHHYCWFLCGNNDTNVSFGRTIRPLEARRWSIYGLVSIKHEKISQPCIKWCVNYCPLS